MVDHRKTLSRKAYVLPGWFLAISAMLCVVGLVGLAAAVVLVPDDDTAPASAAAATVTPAAPTTPSPTPTPSPSESPTPTPEPEPEPAVDRSDISVSVLNATRTSGLARQVAGRVSGAGWTVATVGNWRTGAAQTAVHFPSGRKAEAKLLASDLGIDAVLPSTNGMRSDRLTVILLGLP